MVGQLAEIHADAFKDGVKKNLFHGLVHLDEEKFLKPDFGYNKDNIVYALVSSSIIIRHVISTHNIALFTSPFYFRTIIEAEVSSY